MSCKYEVNEPAGRMCPLHEHERVCAFPYQ